MSRITSATALVPSRTYRSRQVDRRNFLKGAAAGALTLLAPRLAKAQSATKLTGTLSVIDGGGANVTALSTGEGFVLVDSGAPKSGDQVMAGLKNVAAG